MPTKSPGDHYPKTCSGFSFPFIPTVQCYGPILKKNCTAKTSHFLRVLIDRKCLDLKQFSWKGSFSARAKDEEAILQKSKDDNHPSFCFLSSLSTPPSQCGQFEQQRNFEVVELIIIWWDQVAHLSDRSRSAADNPSPAKRAHHCKLPECDGNHTRHRQSIRPNLISDVFSNWIWSVF